MDTTLYTYETRQLIARVREYLPSFMANREDGVNRTMPMMLNTMMAMVEDYTLQWWNEEDPESPVELHLMFAKGEDTFADGFEAASVIQMLFQPNDVQNVSDERDHDGPILRLMFDNEDELSPGDRVKAEGREGVVVEVEREDEDEPRSLRVLIDFDGSPETSWIYRVEVERA
jgi:hypothetical protein